MIRVIFLIIFILFLAWILLPVLKKKGRDKEKVNGKLNSDKSNLRQKNITFIIITLIILIAFFVWLFPKLGINFIALFQKINPILSSLRSILPF